LLSQSEDIEFLPSSPCDLGKRIQPNAPAIASPSQQVGCITFYTWFYRTERAQFRAVRSQLSLEDATIPLDSSVDTVDSPPTIKQRRVRAKVCLVCSAYTVLLWTVVRKLTGENTGLRQRKQQGRACALPARIRVSRLPKPQYRDLRAGLHERSQTRAWHPQGVSLLGTIVVLNHQCRGTTPCVVRSCGSTCPGQFFLASFHVSFISLLFADFTW
jgi:hypothetical protein